jgi:hypothetical protein
LREQELVRVRWSPQYSEFDAMRDARETMDEAIYDLDDAMGALGASIKLVDDARRLMLVEIEKYKAQSERYLHKIGLLQAEVAGLKKRLGEAP